MSGRVPCVVAVVVALALTCATAEDRRRRSLAEDLRVDRIAPGVWRHESVQRQGELGPVAANGLIVVGRSAAALVDTPWTDGQTALLFDWVRASFDVEIEHVVVTHSHADCSGGLAEAHRRGARSYGHRATAEIARAGRAPEPGVTFADEHRIDLDGTGLELRYFGAGHTRDNIVVWISPAKVLFGGCLVKPEGAGAGYIGEADLAAWPDTVRAVLAAFPEARVVVPGHGEPGTLDYLRYTIRFTTELGAR
ncbi:MAG TPA: subclass B1 metallo-beta-lactamase [Candidatus Polarisedimenticolaceae bacterium]|nr:subclass B1 metallo-beta-lactamase [Candidatus Polarisedimenticolaceae bacterium]